MSGPERIDSIIFGSGQGGKLLAWSLARTGKKVAVVERQWVGGSCPAVACLPSKNEIWGARVAYLTQNAERFGTLTGPVNIDTAKIRRRKQDMIEREIAFHLNAYKESGAELIMGVGRLCASDGGRGVRPAFVECATSTLERIINSRGDKSAFKERSSGNARGVPNELRC